MDYSINLHEIVSVSDYTKAESEIDAVIYRQEFERHRTEYLKSKTESELIFTFIFLQIYMECFLHQNMRRIVTMEFKPPRNAILTTWLTGEKRYVPEKMDNFINLFFSPVPTPIQQMADIIKDRLGNISSIRNQFAHGHKVSAWSDSEGNSGSTPAKLILTETQLMQSVAEINELGKAWNDLLDIIMPQCKALKRMDDFKFRSI
ncbi:MAG: hypothetical protein Q8O93_05185 [bacterium]|nr:hypothetical protein [bacterium]